MATIIKQPITKEKILLAEVEELEKVCRRLSKENTSLKYKVDVLLTKIYFLCGAIETSRQSWGRIGAEKSLSDLVLLLKRYPTDRSVPLTAFGVGFKARIGRILISLGCRLTNIGSH